MNTTETAAPKSAAPKRGWLKKLLFAFAGLAVLLVIAWFVVTSDAFFKGTILPRVGKAMNATLTAESASISPFSQVTIHGLKLQTTGAEPLLAVNEVRLRYSLTAILGGTLKVDEVLIDSPVVTVVENADGTRNTDALIQGTKPEAKEPATTGKPPQVDLKQFNLTNATVRYIRNYPGGTRNTIDLTGVNLTLEDVKNGAAGKLAFAFAAKADLNPPDAARRGTLAASHDGKYTFTLGADLVPTQISGSDKLDVTQATGALQELAGAGADMVAEMTPSEVKDIALKFRKQGVQLGELHVSGPFDSLKREGKLNATLSGVDRRLLNLVGGLAGMDFGSTAINSTNVVEFTKGGDLTTVAGRLRVADMQVTRAGQTTPTLQFTADYGVTVDNEKSAATLQSLNLAGQQNGRPLLGSSLSSPMTYSWSKAANAIGDSALTITLSQLNLADWKPFLPGSVSAGQIDATLKLLAQAGGRKFGVDLATDVQHLSTEAGADISTKANLNATVVTSTNALSIAGKLTVSNLVSRSGAKETQVPTTMVDFDVTKTGDVIELKQLLAKLAASTRAKNELMLTGRVDRTNPEAITGGLKLTAESLDVTSYYDLFAGDKTAKPETKPAAPAEPEQEPEAMTLPFRNFTCDANLGHVYLREVDLASVQATAKLDGSLVTVKPLQCSLNGAPITGSAELNPGVLGFQYEFAFDAPNVPLAPLVNSFQPERKGQIAGTATASVQLKGEGITGASLQKNLAGQFDLAATNLNLSLGNVRTPVIKSLINVVIAIPDAIRNPTAAVGNLLGGLLGAKRESSGWVDELMKSPVNEIVAHGTAGSGKVELKQAFIQSSAFRGDATGTINIASVLTNSTMQFPVSVSLSKGLADKAGLTPANTPTNAVYVQLPDFVKMGGTLGVPKPDVNYLVLAQLALKSGGGILGNTGGAATDRVGGALGVVEGLLGGGQTTKTATTNATSATNPPTAKPVNELIRGFGDLLGGQKPATNTPPPKTAP